VSDGRFDLLQAQRAVFRSTLRAPEKLVGLALLDHWSRGSETFPSVQRLAAWTSLDRTSVMRALQGLEQRGAIIVTRRKGAPNRYELGQLTLLPVAESDRSTTTPVAESDGSGTDVGPTPVAESDQSLSTTSRTERHPPVAESDTTSRTERHEGTQEGTQTRNPLEKAFALESSPTEGASKRNGRSKRNKPKSAPAPATPLPPDWQPTEAHRKYAENHGLDLELEVDSLKGWAEGRTQISWNGTFSTRLANQAKWNKQRGNGRRVDVQRGVANEAEANSWGRAKGHSLARGPKQPNAGLWKPVVET
jgi:hypothetical protein